MKKTFILHVLFFNFLFAYSQQGKITGKIIDAGMGESLIGATVVLTGTTHGTITDFDGNYSINNLEPGTYSITISYVSYETQQVDGVEVQEGEVTTVDINLAEANTAIEEVKVVARQRQQTEVAMLTLQRKSANVIDGVSSQQISLLGDSDAASALKRLPGVSVQEGKYVYVRGLSDRYMKVTLNGAEVPGLDPNINTVQMDLFPGNIIENMTVLKTYNPDRPAFTGGLVDIVTKDFPEKFSLEFSASMGYNTNASLNNNFLSQENSSTDWLGYDDGLRSIPDEADGMFLFSPARSDEREDIESVARSFTKSFEPVQKKSFLDQSYSLSTGNNFQLGKTELGIIGALNYKRNNAYYNDGFYGEYNALDDEIMQNEISLNEIAGTENVIWSALIGGTLKLNPNHKIGFMLMRSQSGSSTARLRNGISNYDGFSMRQFVQEYLERQLNSFQLKGKHVIEAINNSTIDWSSSTVLSNQSEPDFRIFIDRSDEIADGEYAYEMIDNRKPDRRYREMSEINYDNKIHFTIPFSNWAGRSKVKLGGGYLMKKRDSDENLWKLNWYRSTPYNGVPNDFISEETLYDIESNRGSFYYNSKKSNQASSYTAKEDILSAYTLLDIPVFEKMRLAAGVRVEVDNIELQNKVDTVEFNTDLDKESFKYTEKQSNDILPSFNLTYNVTDKMNLRLGYNLTIARPFFREIAPYQYFDFISAEKVQGNPELESGKVTNLDFRWEYFFQAGQIVSFSLFYKNFENPIEKFVEQSANTVIKYRNGEDAKLYGIEFEARKNLDFMGLEKLQIGTNITVIHSKQAEDSARLAEAKVTVPDWPEERRMYGQSPYVVNAYMTYRNSDFGFDASLSYNIAGPKIIKISQYQTPDILEMPVHMLNLTATKSLTKNFSVKIKVKNLLNQKYRQSYILAEEEYYYRNKSLGTKYELGISYKF
jgi:outer membrane receptor protein involved in Fe transport